MWLQIGESLVVLVLWWFLRNGSRFSKMIDTFPGPLAYPIIGNAHLLGRSTSEFHNSVVKYCRQYNGSPFRMWVGPFAAYIVLSNPEDIEIILSSYNFIDKGDLYDFFLAWLGTGLLTSTGEKWRRHRKLLTPTFHFKILKQFVDIFNTNAQVLVAKLRKEVNRSEFDVYKYVTLCALDDICESAMGVRINAQKGFASEYVEALKDQTDVFMQRSMKPWLRPDFFFNLTSLKKTHERSLKILHGTTKKVIRTRKEEMQKAKQIGPDDDAAEDGVRKRLAFLDLMLIESSKPGSQLTDEDIREEVDTFLLEGYDTISSGISFTLWLLSRNQEIQNKAFQEIDKMFTEVNGVLTYRALQDMKYLERVIKESLRMYPSVPFYARELQTDVKLSDGRIGPKGSTIAISAFMAHRNPTTFPDPDKFDPDRFLPERSQGRHPYAFLAFSAGPRNCIGQKFAMLEMKSTIAHVLRSFQLLPASKTPNLKLAVELTLISKTGVPIRLLSRNNN